VPLTVYRIVRNNPPSWVDFLPNATKDLPPRGAESDPLIWAAISTFADPAAAAQRARRYGLGGFLAELLIPDDGAVPIEGVPGAFGLVVARPTLGPGHYSLISGPVTFMRAVARALPV
jgi:hypothetical protein